MFPAYQTAIHTHPNHDKYYEGLGSTVGLPLLAILLNERYYRKKKHRFDIHDGRDKRNEPNHNFHELYFRLPYNAGGRRQSTPGGTLGSVIRPSSSDCISQLAA